MRRRFDWFRFVYSTGLLVFCVCVTMWSGASPLGIVTCWGFCWALLHSFDLADLRNRVAQLEDELAMLRASHSARVREREEARAEVAELDGLLKQCEDQCDERGCEYAGAHAELELANQLLAELIAERDEARAENEQLRACMEREQPKEYPNDNQY